MALIYCGLGGLDLGVRQRTCLLVSTCRLTDSKENVKDKEIESRDELQIGQILRGFVFNSSRQGIFVRYVRAHLHPATATRLRHRCDDLNRSQSDSPATAKLVAAAVANAQCNSTTTKQ